MLGSTIIFEKDHNRLAGITSVDDLGDFVCLELAVMTTLDFATIATSGGMRWAESEPIRYDPDSGMAIFKTNQEALSYVLAHVLDFDEAQQADLRNLADFVRANGGDYICEFATF